MNDLPDPAQSSVTSNAQDPNPKSVSSTYSSGNKEVMSGGFSSQESLKDVTGQELDLPKEVVSAGVRMQPTTISIPPPIAKLGVQASGSNVPVQTSPAVVLPLTDDQIAKGLHEGINNSVRWLAEWCMRRLKHLHYTLKSVHGSLIRVKE
jgi:hypothetical protein